MLRQGSLLSVAVMLAGCGGHQASPAAAHRPTPTAFARAVATVRTGVSPVAVAIGDGAVWVANNGAGTVTRIDPRTRRAVGRPIRVGAGPVALTAAPSGVWVALASGFVVRIDPGTGRRAGQPVAVSDPAGIAADGDRIWVTSRAEDQLVRIDARSARISGRPIAVGSAPTDVAVGEGAVWTANSGDGTVTRVDPATGQPGIPIRVAKHHELNPGDGGGPVSQPGGEVLALAVGEGGVWVAKTDSRLTASVDVVRIDPQTSKVTGDPIRVTGAIPMHLAAGGGGVWITDVGSIRPGAPAREPSLLRIDPGTLQLSGRPIRVGGQPAGVAVGRGLWVANAGDNTVSEIGRR